MRKAKKTPLRKGPAVGKKAAARAKTGKPRGEVLLERLDKNQNDQEAWNELATGQRKPKRGPGVKRKRKTFIPSIVTGKRPRVKRRRRL